MFGVADFCVCLVLLTSLCLVVLISLCLVLLTSLFGGADIFLFGCADILVIGGADFCVCLAGLDRSCRTAAVHPSPGGGGHQQLAQGSHLLQQVPPHPTY